MNSFDRWACAQLEFVYLMVEMLRLRVCIAMLKMSLKARGIKWREGNDE